ncbi:hypothetical protein [uncultured Tateyamaria sp.]|uniref:hypothetical protein n=1 Tax=Tateyamaria sp. 1078 TaxID=3417464 RepID=UPI00262D7345|nr:hypothetical protein [uncultured Tateyamaria sp.]
MKQVVFFGADARRFHDAHATGELSTPMGLIERVQDKRDEIGCVVECIAWVLCDPV